LQQQGYDLSDKELSQLSWGLRFTPLVCMTLAIYGILTHNPNVLFPLAALGILPFWFPNHHPLDHFYNGLVCPLFKGVRLPANPLPRRIACFTGGMMNVFAGLAFYNGSVLWGYILGGVLVVLQIVVISTHFCLASWMYEGFMKLNGKWKAPINLAKAQKLISEGAIWIDVRNPDEFDKESIEGALNFPLPHLSENLNKLDGKVCLIYCKSGLRSQEATKVIQNKDLNNIYNFGSMSRWLLNKKTN
jgi:rhodanese-related sulfurtransferase